MMADNNRRFYALQARPSLRKDLIAVGVPPFASTVQTSSTLPSTPKSDSSATERRLTRVSKGAIAGSSVGAVVAIVASASVCYWLSRRTRRKHIDDR